MYLQAILVTLLLYLLLLQKKIITNNSSNIDTFKDCVKYYPEIKDTEIKSMSVDYPNKYDLYNDIPKSNLVAKNENENHENHINYENTALALKKKNNLLPMNYLLIDPDFHTPVKGKEIIPSESKYKLVDIKDTNYFLVNTPNSIWCQIK